MQVLRRAISAAITLEAHSRGALARKERRRLAMDKLHKESATAIQRIQRGRIARRVLRTALKAATTLQRECRKHAAQVAYRRSRAAIVHVQSMSRRNAERARYRLARRRCIAVQTEVRRWEAEMLLARSIRSAIILEKQSRGTLARMARRTLWRPSRSPVPPRRC